MTKFHITRLVVNIAGLMDSCSRILQTTTIGELPIGLNTMQTSVIIDLSSDRRMFKIWTPCYSEAFKIGLLKGIPKFFRRWDRDQRCWRIETSWIGNAQKLIEKCYPQFIVEYSERAALECERIAFLHDQELKANAPPRPKRQGKQKTYSHDDDSFCPSNVSAYAILGVLESAPDDVIRAAYKAHMKTLHPDLGGDPQKAKQIISAYEDIAKERKWKG